MDAQRKQNLVVGLVLVAFGVLVVGTLIYSRGSGTVTNKALTRKPFVAKAGTMRKNAKPIYTKAPRDMPSGTAAPSGEGTGSSAADGSGASGGEGSDSPPSESPEIQEALDAPTPEEGIEALEEHLKTLDAVAEASAVYTALGQLHARKSPPDDEAALQALATAAELAQTDEQAHDAALVQARLLTEQDPAAALDVARNALATHPEPTASGIQLAIKEGILLEDSGDPKAAENAYKQAIESVEAATGQVDSETTAAYRQACIRLSRLYRKTRRDDEANALARKMKRLNET
jgi:tetratricopeptide (TPR) repeat protein